MPTAPARRCTGCRRLHHGPGARCPDCRALADRARGTTTDRGYGWAHQQTRDQWQPVVDRGDATCSRCHTRIQPGEAWALDHDDEDRTRYLGPAHELCNAIAGGRRRQDPRRGNSPHP
jgi:hypothetical protein